MHAEMNARAPPPRKTPFAYVCLSLVIVAVAVVLLGLVFGCKLLIGDMTGAQTLQAHGCAAAEQCAARG